MPIPTGAELDAGEERGDGGDAAHVNWTEFPVDTEELRQRWLERRR
ncbi:MAG: hypothetical protein WBM50_09780 [Acidimicrobiales bacterium]